jgi:hypothetical protein
MRPGVRFGVATAALFAFAVLGVVGAEEEKPKYTIKQVMGKAHGEEDGLLDVVLEGKATAAQKKELVELYTALSKNKPPKGEAKSWKEKTDALVGGATAVADDKDGGLKKLKAAADCKGCHTAHRVPKGG